MRSFTRVTLVKHPDNLPKSFHMRRCQSCSAVNIHPIIVNKCVDCRKPIAPFFYFEESGIQVTAEKLRPYYRPRRPTEYGPLYGVSVLWSD